MTLKERKIVNEKFKFIKLKNINENECISTKKCNNLA